MGADGKPREDLAGKVIRELVRMTIKVGSPHWTFSSGDSADLYSLVISSLFRLEVRLEIALDAKGESIVQMRACGGLECGGGGGLS
jgi:hypothetical protein